MITEELYKIASSEIGKVHRADASEDTEGGATYPAE
jgi:hypothetical protein